MSAFRVARDGIRLSFRWPEGAFDRQRLDDLAAEAAEDGLRIDLRCDGGSGTLELDGSSNPPDAAASRLFARLNGYPVQPVGTFERFRASDRPRVSCILLLPFNDLFARHAVLPSIIANSSGHDIEIVVVHAGLGAPRPAFRRLRGLDSEMGSIARGYNAGVAAARGEIVALFHDDCLLEDPRWLDRALDALTPGVGAVTPELDEWCGVPVAKAVPLVMRRRTFLEVGGYDELYYVGVEDMDLTCALLARGLRVERVEIGYRHLRGMGTSLTVHEEPLQLRRLYGFQVLPPTVIRRVHADSMARLLKHPFIRLLEGCYHMHFIDKYADLLRERFGLDPDERRELYARLLLRHLKDADIRVVQDRDRLLAEYRRMMNLDELRAAA